MMDINSTASDSERVKFNGEDSETYSFIAESNCDIVIQFCQKSLLDLGATFQEFNDLQWTDVNAALNDDRRVSVINTLTVIKETYTTVHDVVHVLAQSILEKMKTMRECFFNLDVGIEYEKEILNTFFEKKISENLLITSEYAMHKYQNFFKKISTSKITALYKQYRFIENKVSKLQVRVMNKIKLNKKIYVDLNVIKLISLTLKVSSEYAKQREASFQESFFGLTDLLSQLKEGKKEMDLSIEKFRNNFNFVDHCCTTKQAPSWYYPSVEYFVKFSVLRYERPMYAHTKPVLESPRFKNEDEVNQECPEKVFYITMIFNHAASLFDVPKNDLLSGDALQQKISLSSKTLEAEEYDTYLFNEIEGIQKENENNKAHLADAEKNLNDYKFSLDGEAHFCSFKGDLLSSQKEYKAVKELLANTEIKIRGLLGKIDKRLNDKECKLVHLLDSIADPVNDMCKNLDNFIYYLPKTIEEKTRSLFEFAFQCEGALEKSVIECRERLEKLIANLKIVLQDYQSVKIGLAKFKDDYNFFAYCCAHNIRPKKYWWGFDKMKDTYADRVLQFESDGVLIALILSASDIPTYDLLEDEHTDFEAWEQETDTRFDGTNHKEI